MPDTQTPAFVFHQGSEPLLISMPHVGTYVTRPLFDCLTPAAQQLADTDWHLPRLYRGAIDLGASLLIATHSRYVIDLNRPPDGASLYPGQSETRLCPTDTFAHEPLYDDGHPGPDATEVAARHQHLWQPYHERLAAELARLRAAHGVAVLWDAHSTRSQVPRFFDGRLPDLNWGTAGGASCARGLSDALLQVSHSSGYSSVLNGRFQGGYITRHYGQPGHNIHAVQLELAQRCYMHEGAPFDYAPERAAHLQPHLLRLLQTALEFAHEHAG